MNVGGFACTAFVQLAVPLPFLPLADFEFAPFLETLGLTLRLALTTTAILLVLGIPLAHWLNISRLPGIGLVQTVVGLPIVLPPDGHRLLSAGGFRAGASARLVVDGNGQARPLSFSFLGLVVGSVFYSLPYAVQPFQAALGGVPDALVEAAAASGAAPWRAFWRVRVPLARRGLLVGRDVELRAYGR